MTDDYIIRRGARVLYPSEYRAVRAELNYTHQLIFNAMLFTGMRSTEFWRFVANPGWFKPSRKCIDLPQGSMLKAKAKQAERTVLLSDWGLYSIESLLSYMKLNEGEITPISRQGWSQDLHRAATKAVENGTLSSSTGIVPKMARKTWVSWLLATHHEREGSIAISSGHDVATMLTYYIGLGFPSHEIEAMKMYTAGWGE